MSGFSLYYSHLMFTHIGLQKVATHFSAQRREVLNERRQRVQMPSKPAFTAEARLYFTFSRTDVSLFLLQDEEGERRISFFGSSCTCLLCPDPANPATLMCVPLVLTQSPTDFSEKTCGNKA